MISSVQHTKTASGQNLSSRDYYRDERDRIWAWQKSTNNSVNPMEDGRGDHYSYDAEGQLTDAWYNAVDPAGSSGSCLRQDHFNLDALGNRRAMDYVQTKGWQNFTRKDNRLNQYRMWSPYSIINYDDDIGGTWGSPGNANGVLMQDGWITAGYNALNQPMLAWSPAYNGTSNWMFFGYDPLGRCVKRWVAPLVDGWIPPIDSNPATYYYYDGWNLIQDGPQSWNAEKSYIHGARVDELVASYRVGGDVVYHHYDARGHCTMLTDSAGTIREQYEYDAFGFPYFYDAAGNNIGYSPFTNRFLFTGREWLSDLKLYDYRNRLYQPELGRFLQPDPKEFAAGDYNLYRYCHNDPVNMVDPFGLQDDKPVVVKEFSKNVFHLGSQIPIHITYTVSGNWNNTTIADHYDSHLEETKGLSGSTNGIGSFDQNGSDIHVDLNVNWFVDSKYANTDVVARELQHVRDFHGFSNAFANSLDANKPLPFLSGFPSNVANFQRENGIKYDPDRLTGGRIYAPHNLEYHPPRPFMLPTRENTANEAGR
jgi:RHS repeat-associated protein